MDEGEDYRASKIGLDTSEKPRAVTLFIKTKKENWLAFSILIQNYVGSSTEARKIQDKLCEILFEEL